MSNRPIWIDTDPGVDDAFALVSAFKLPGIEVVGISAVSGNVELEYTFDNARNIVSLCGREDVKVYKGASRPLREEPHYAHEVHGANGIGGQILKPSSAPIETTPAWTALYEKAKELNGELTVVAVGPLTNIATTIITYPDFTKYIKEILIMGGSVGFGGNTTIAAEFNVYADPHAAQIVMKCGVPITMFGLDVTMKTVLYRNEIELLKDETDDVGKFLYRSSFAPMSLYNSIGFGDVMCLHDTCPLVYLSDPSLFSGKKAGVYVETRSSLSLGRTVSDLYVHADKLFDNKNVMVMLDVDRDRVAKIAIETFRAY